jgi:hypothetical protein
MTNINDYIIISGISAHEIMKVVKDKISNGYIPLGSVSCSQSPLRFHQAMIKYATIP